MRARRRPSPHRLPARARRRRDLQGARLSAGGGRRRRGRARTASRLLASSGGLKDLPNVGDTTARVIAEAVAGKVPSYLDQLEAVETVPLSAEARCAQRPCSRATATATRTGPTAAARSARWPRPPPASGHDYLVLTDHSPRLTVARGLNAERLREQLEVVAELNEELAPFRLLTGIEVDILEDGSLDQDEELLARARRRRRERPLQAADGGARR